MSIQTATNRFIFSPLRVVRAELYQDIFRSTASFKELGNRLIRYAEHAQAIRQTELVQEVGQVLANFPIRNYQTVGQYYLALCDYKHGINNMGVFEHVAEYAPTIYRARALQSLAAIEARRQDYSSELRWLIESMKVYPSTEALRGIAVVKAKEGYHTHALKDLEPLHNLVQHGELVSYLQYLNSYAVELGEVGRKDEARNVIRHVVSSPLAFAYPEWQETARDLREPDRSFVTIDRASNQRRNVVRMPLVEHVESQRISYNQPARVTDLQQWKTKMGKDEEPEEDLDTRQIIFRIINFYTNKDTTNSQRFQIWEAVQKIMSRPSPPDTDSDDSEGA